MDGAEHLDGMAVAEAVEVHRAAQIRVHELRPNIEL
jgi:hypothetical protein